MSKEDVFSESFIIWISWIDFFRIIWGGKIMLGKTALVTGASRGIGRHIAKCLASEGYDLILVCQKNETLLNDLADKLHNKYGVQTECFVGDVNDISFVAMIFANITHIDVLVNNAGISYFGLLHEMTPEEWHRVMSCNLDSVFYFSKEAVHLMLQKKSGRIINISSVWGNCGASLEACYSASKGAVNSLTKSLAKELAPSHITVNAIACGLIDTDMNKHLTDEEIEEIVADIPADRMGHAGEVGQMVISILNAPEYMTGQIINLDGGWI